MEIRGVIGEACATAIGIVLAAFIVSYATNLGKVIPALGELPLWVAIVALLSIGGRVLGALAGVSGAMRASIVSPEAVGYARGGCACGARGAWLTDRSPTGDGFIDDYLTRVKVCCVTRPKSLVCNGC